MPPSPLRIQPESFSEPLQEAANEEHFFNDGVCVETLNQEDIHKLFNKRKATEWLVKNRTDGSSQEVYHNELARIKAEMKRYAISEEDYEKFLTEIGIMVD